LVRFLWFLGSAGNCFTAGLPLILILIAQHQGAAPTVIGLVFTIGSIGGFVGSIIGLPIQKRFHFGPVVIVTSWVGAMVWLIYAFQPHVLLLGVISAVFWSISLIYDVGQFSYRLALIPDELQGRVNSAFRLLAYGFIPLGVALTGALLQWVGVVPTVL